MDFGHQRIDQSGRQRRGQPLASRGGLPVGPIGNPGAAALAAVLAPERRDTEGRAWLYFLHGRDGGFYPNLDYASHLRDVERYLR